MIQKEFILSELHYRYPGISGVVRYPALPVGRPLLMEASDRSPGAHVVVCRSDELNAALSGEWREPLYLCIGSPEQRILDALDVCILPSFEQPAAVLNFVQRLFDRLDEWLQRLRQTAESGSDITELLDDASGMLQNPVFLIDSMGHVVAQSGLIDGPTDESLGRFSHHLASKENQKTGSGEMSDALLANLTVGEARYTLYCPAIERPIYGSDEVVFEYLSGYARLMLSAKKLHARGLRHQRGMEAAELTIRSLLAKEISEEQATERLDKLGWSEADSYCVAAAVPFDLDLREAHANEICDRMEKSLSGCCAFADAPYVVAVFPSDYKNEAPLRNILTSISSDVSVRFGVCESLAGFSHLAQRLEIAQTALALSDDAGQVAFYADVAEEYAVSHIALDTSPELLALRSVLALAQSDREHGTAYLETLERYVKNRFNAVKTANDLFIHRSTFLYRLERIKTQFGLDPDSEDVSLLHLSLSLRIATSATVKK